MNLHRCPAPGCQEMMPFGRFMCRDHWRMLPAGLQAAIWRNFTAGNWLAHRAARQAAVKFVSEAENSPHAHP